MLLTGSSTYILNASPAPDPPPAPAKRRKTTHHDPTPQSVINACTRNGGKKTALTPTKPRSSSEDRVAPLSDSGFSTRNRQRIIEDMDPAEQKALQIRQLKFFSKYYDFINEGTNTKAFLMDDRTVFLVSKNPQSFKNQEPKCKPNRIAGVPTVYPVGSFQIMDYAGPDGYTYLENILQHGCPQPDATTSNQSAETLNRLSRDFRETVFADLLQSLRSLHQQGYTHRDIKAENFAFNPSTQKASFIDVYDISNKNPEKKTGTPSTAHPLHYAYLYSEKTDEILNDYLKYFRAKYTEYTNHIQTLSSSLRSNPNYQQYKQLQTTLSTLSNTDPDIETIKSTLGSLENILKNDFDQYELCQSKQNLYGTEYSRSLAYRSKQLPPLTIELWKKFDTYSLHITELLFLLVQVDAAFGNSNIRLAHQSNFIIDNLTNQNNFSWKFYKIDQDINYLLQLIDQDPSGTKTILSAEIQRIHTLNQLFFSVKHITDIPTAETLVPQTVTPSASSDSSDTSSEHSYNSTPPAELTTTTASEAPPLPPPATATVKPDSTS